MVGKRDTVGVKGKGESRWKDVGEMSKSMTSKLREGRQRETLLQCSLPSGSRDDGDERDRLTVARLHTSNI